MSTTSPTPSSRPLPNALLEQMRHWRRDLHAHPETAFEEFRTSQIVAGLLQNMGLEVHRGLAKTGVVATLRRGPGPAIGLRADMDALDIEEVAGRPHGSVVPGKMHACGHDGHTAMLLGAASHLAQDPGLNGTVHFIFQPAEEHAGGGREMVRDGLFERFPCQAVFALHNAPNLPFGTLSTRTGPITSHSETFEIAVTGKGSHAAQPEAGVDAIVVAARLVGDLQTIVSRNIPAADSLVVSVTQFHAGASWNVLPDQVVLRGTCRALNSKTATQARQRILDLCQGLEVSYGCRTTVSFFAGYPACVNTPAETALAVQVAETVLGSDKVDAHCAPRSGSEDFAFLLEHCPGAYVLLGAARDGANPPLHNAAYDFHDDLLGIGAAYWVEMARRATRLNPG
ncbi:MAG: amidohydrolase [Curvibacter sp.]|nr:amidohydrolase [Curvibacter sp.]